MRFKKFLVYLLFLLPWFISNLIFKIDTAYYQSLDRPWFAPPPIIFGIVWPILYALIAYSVYKTWSNSNSNYKIYLVINYIANQLYTLFFFVLKNNFLSLVDTIIILISSLYLYIETKKLKQRKGKIFNSLYIMEYICININIYNLYN